MKEKEALERAIKNLSEILKVTKEVGKKVQEEKSSAKRGGEKKR